MFRVSYFVFRASGFRFRVSGFGFLVSGLGFRVPGFWYTSRMFTFGITPHAHCFRVSGFGRREIDFEGETSRMLTAPEYAKSGRKNNDIT